MSLSPRLILSYSLAVLISCQPGCLALSIPSERFDDPADRGGLLGDWRGKSILSPATGLSAVGNWEDPSLCGGPLVEHPGAPEAGAGGRRERAAEVPWPRFHPVPTRPVFGGPPASP